MPEYKLGKLPAQPEAVKFSFASLVTPSKLPRVPASFGYEQAVPRWGMYANDRIGDCVFAGAAHETRLWNRMRAMEIPFRDDDVLDDYSAVTGYDPSNPSTDRGTNMSVAASYRRKTGVRDAYGNRHQVAAYLALEPGNLTQLWQALYLFGAVGVGFVFPSTAMRQFEQGQPWSIVRGASVRGGHYVSGVARRNGRLTTISWGRPQQMTTGFYQRYCDEALAYVSWEMLDNTRSPLGFDSKTLLEMLAQLG